MYSRELSTLREDSPLLSEETKLWAFEHAHGVYKKKNRSAGLKAFMQTVNTEFDLLQYSVALYNYITGRIGKYVDYPLNEATFNRNWMRYTNISALEKNCAEGQNKALFKKFLADRLGKQDEM